MPQSNYSYVVTRKDIHSNKGLLIDAGGRATREDTRSYIERTFRSESHHAHIWEHPAEGAALWVEKGRFVEGAWIWSPPD